MSADYAAKREIMVDSQVRPQDVTDLAIQDAMRAVRREAVLPPAKANLAYADTEIEYAPGRWLLSPRDVAKLLQGLRPKAGETALAIAAPYAAAVLEAMGLTVTRLDGPDLTTATVAGQWPLIVCEGAVTRAPRAWIDALAPGGRLGVVERNGPAGRAMIYLRSTAGAGSRPLFDCAPPLMAGFEPEPGFVF
jgi:protein-L-isoaspartate(D-aspartate) O-methyltransferase